MKKVILTIVSILFCVAAKAATSYTVKVVYDGTTATVTIPDAVSGYVTCMSGTSSHVKLVQRLPITLVRSSMRSLVVVTMASSISRAITRLPCS